VIYEIIFAAAAKAAIVFSALTVRLKPHPFKTKSQADFLKALRPPCNIRRQLFLVLRIYHATAALPSDLNDLAIFDQQRDTALPWGQRGHALTSLSVSFDIVLNEVRAFPLQPFAHLLRVRAARCAEEFKLGHGPVPPMSRG
jgi:hypothetical protein